MTPYWLIEHSGARPATWWTGRGACFTADANRALRFSRRQDADIAKEHLCPYGVAYRVTEHLDMAPTRPEEPQ